MVRAATTKKHTGLLSYFLSPLLPPLFPNSLVIFISLWAHPKLTNSCLTNQCRGAVNEKHFQAFPLKGIPLPHRQMGAQPEYPQVGSCRGHPGVCLWCFWAILPSSGKGGKWCPGCSDVTCITDTALVCSVGTILLMTSQ